MICRNADADGISWLEAEANLLIGCSQAVASRVRLRDGGSVSCIWLGKIGKCEFEWPCMYCAPHEALALTLELGNCGRTGDGPL